MLPVLTPVEIRALGCLIEKEMATPEYYPLTLNSLVAACCQKNNRDPVMDIGETVLEPALESLRLQHRLVLFVREAGARSGKYRHDVPDRLPLTRPEIALLCELMLRGPQTPGELRGRASRLHPFETPAEVENLLVGLSMKEGVAYVVKLPVQPGRREARYAQLLGGEPVLDTAAAIPAAMEVAAAPKTDRVVELERRLEETIAELKALRAEFDAFKAQLGA